MDYSNLKPWQWLAMLSMRVAEIEVSRSALKLFELVTKANEVKQKLGFSFFALSIDWMKI